MSQETVERVDSALQGALTPVALVFASHTAPAWRRAVLTLAERYALRVVRTEERQGVSTVPVPSLLRAALRADRWRPVEPAGATAPSEATAAEAPALLLLLGDRPPDGALLARCRGGVLHATAGGRPLGGAADLLAEVARGVPTATIEVWWTRNDRPPERVLRSVDMMRSAVARINDSLFAVRIAELLLVGVRRVLDRVQRADADTDPLAELAGTVPPSEGASTDLLTQRAVADVARAAAPLRTSDAVRLFARRVSTSLAARGRAREWAMAYRRTRGESALASFGRLAESELLLPPPGVTWADPFPVHAEGVDLLFFEEQRSLREAGRLRCAELLPDGRLGAPSAILDDVAGHLSYPNVFSWQGEWFLVPESASRGVVSLYRAEAFPYRWRHECDLLTGAALVDPTLLEHDGRWYLVATRVAADDVALEDLCCWSAPTLTGPWRPHRGNPVVSDAYRGRPAGQFFVEDGRLLRPAQDSSVTYGHGVSLQHVTAMSDAAWSEVTVAHLTADWAPHLDGVHTFNRSATLTCIDVARRVRRSSAA